MRYISTRGQAPPVSFLDAVLAGMAPDGGLYVPETWERPQYPELLRGAAARAPYAGVAELTLEYFAGERFEGIREIANDAYPSSAHSSKWPPEVTQRRSLRPHEWLLELFHGPSLSFKDIAMQLIAPLYEAALKVRNERLSVVCATSGDTGGAAVEALKNRERLDLFVLTPKSRVSEVQRRFMTTSGAANIHIMDVDGDFDACQAVVKALFADADFAARARLSGVNSINWARIVAQSVYYQIASVGAGPFDFVVPTGNFGNAYSGWAAKQLGAPIGRIVLATNVNDILVRALATGTYQRAPQSSATISPAMDIQIASNFERILYEALDRDGDAVAALYAQLTRDGGFNIPEAALRRLREEFIAESATDEETSDTLRRYAERDVVVCPHTAAGLAVASKLAERLDSTVIALATAHPAKFPETVERATGVRPQLPAKCADLFERPEKFDSLPADAEAVKQYIRERSRAWS